jgi:hypothetical protein
LERFGKLRSPVVARQYLGFIPDLKTSFPKDMGNTLGEFCVGSGVANKNFHRYHLFNTTVEN